METGDRARRNKKPRGGRRNKRRYLQKEDENNENNENHENNENNGWIQVNTDCSVLTIDTYPFTFTPPPPPPPPPQELPPMPPLIAPKELRKPKELKSFPYDAVKWIKGNKGEEGSKWRYEWYIDITYLDV